MYFVFCYFIPYLFHGSSVDLAGLTTFMKLIHWGSERYTWLYNIDPEMSI